MWWGFLRLVLHLGCLVPLVWLVWIVFSMKIGADPAEKIVRYLGFWGACLLWASLAITPLRILTHQSRWVGFRRALGLWSFFYISMHLMAFVVIWAGLDADIVMEEISGRPYIYLGLAAWLLLLPLALTSTKGWRKRLGRRWQRLHQSVYLVAALVMVHIIWVAKLDYFQPAIFGVVLVGLLVVRRFDPLKRASRQRAGSSLD